MSLRNDLGFVLCTIGDAIRQIIGVTCRKLADHFLGNNEPQQDTPEQDTPEKKPSPRSRNHSKRVKPTARAKPLEEPSPIEDDEDEEPLVVKQSKPRDRDKYDCRDHGSFQLAGPAILKYFLSNEANNVPVTIRELHKLTNEPTSSSMIRTACKTLIKEGFMASELPSGAVSEVFWISDYNAAREYFQKKFPDQASQTSGETNPSLN